MKQFYLLLTACLCLAMSVNAQTKYWIGPSGGTWSNPANWSSSTGGAPEADVPNGNTYNVILDKNVTIDVNIGTINLNSLSVTGSVTVRLQTTTTASEIVVRNTAGNALDIASTATLEQYAAAGFDLGIRFFNNAKGLVAGNWNLQGVSTPAVGAAYTQLPGTTGLSNLVTVSGSIKIGTESIFQSSVPAYVAFTNTSTLEIARDGGSIPRVTWDAASTLLLSGTTTSAPAWSTPVVATGLGNVVINCPGAIDELSLNLPNNLLVKGNFTVVNTNNQQLILGNGVTTASMSCTIEGNLDLYDDTYVSVGGDNLLNSYTLQIGGNILMIGGILDLQSTTAAATQPVTLRVKGDIIQSGSSQFICSNNTVSTTTELFVVELNGTASAQQASFGSEILDNTNHQVVLRLNNALGATLQSNLQVGKLSWNSAAKGILTVATGNYLYVANPDLADPLVVNGPSSTGFVAGKIRRAVQTTSYFSLPTGSGTTLRACELQPASNGLSVYEAEYVAGAYPTTTVTAPLTAVSNQEYWNISKIAGSNAVVRLTLAGAVPGASATDTIVIAHFNGSTWTDVRGSQLTPGNSTTGSLTTVEMSSFSPFTFAFTANSALPIFLTSFTGRQEGTGTLLNWAITDNSTPREFEILRSTNGTNYTSIGTVQGEERKLNYNFTDTKLPNGTVYYRLRMVDINGSAELSRIVTIMNGSKGVVITSMMPTLVTSRSRLQITSSDNNNIELVVTDLYGRSVHRQVHGITRGNQEIWLNLANLPVGTYQVTGYLRGGEKTSTLRFIKQ
ncbi:hypothetical protein [Paraflavitalea pollutisoli]|uniref:hypothetical protein n=1 Tax=Paraflavitalea pollutisoli TaxID=3034143 RepID=UPI0023EC27EA|nr:hypothetical protein [Paraflavitalea sp. H1-2-19X]